MCSPVAAFAAVSVVKTIADYNDQRRQAATLRQQAEQENQELNRTLDDAHAQTDARAKEEMSVRARAALLERGRLTAIAADSGVTGNSQDRVLRESRFNEGYDITTIETNRTSQQAQIERARRSGDLTYARQLAAARGPSPLGAMLSIGGNVAGAYALNGGSRTPISTRPPQLVGDFPSNDSIG
jgi:hypothetical protein